MAKLVYHMATDRTGHGIATGVSGAHHADLRQSHTDGKTVQRNKNSAHLVQQVEKQRHDNHRGQLRIDKGLERIPRRQLCLRLLVAAAAPLPFRPVQKPQQCHRQQRQERRCLESRSITKMVCHKSAEEISRRISQRQSTDVITHGMVAIFIRGQRVDVKRHVKRRHGAVGKTIERMNNGKDQDVLRQAIKIVGDPHSQDGNRHKQSRDYVDRPCPLVVGKSEPRSDPGK